MAPVLETRTFRTAEAFRKWLERHHASKDELLVRLYKVHAKHRGMTYAEAIDEALCFGWIDGVRPTGDEDTFSVRFTPRRARSIWSAANIKKVNNLQAAGRMHESGLAAFRKRDTERSEIYAYENRQTELSPEYAKTLRSNERAWKFFQAQAPWYRRTSIYRVMSAKREETREKRLSTLIEYSAKGKPIPQLDRTKA